MDTTLLRQLYKINSKSGIEDDMQDFIMSYIEQRDGLPNVPKCTMDMDAKGNLLVVSGEAESYPCLCAHMDEIHAPVFDKEVIEHLDFMFCFSAIQMSVVGCGADDKNGIFIALKALDVLPAVKLLFTVEEEWGAIGAYKVDIKKWLKDVRYVIQCDRRGSGDFITNITGTKLASKEFKKDAGRILEGYGFRETTGMLTDVMVLKEEGLAVSCCNLSCGYYSPHTDKEVTYLPHLENTFHAVMEICLTLTKVYSHNHVRRVYPTGAGRVVTYDKFGYPIYHSLGTKHAPLNPDSNVCRDCLKLNCDNCGFSVPISPKGFDTTSSQYRDQFDLYD